MHPMTEDTDFRAPRVHLEADLAAGTAVPCTRAQTNYLRNVLRLSAGGKILVFNGRDGEWQAELDFDGRRDASLTPRRQVRPQQAGPDLHYLFAPLKHARLDYMVQKATEMGAARLAPVLTQRTVPGRVNLDRMRANAIEAAEQCGILTIPEVAEPRRLETVLSDWDAGRALIFCDERAATTDPMAALAGVKSRALRCPDRARGRVRGRRARDAAVEAFRRSHLAGAPHHAGRYGGRSGSRACERRPRGLEIGVAAAGL